MKVINIRLEQDIIPTRKNCLWYGGGVLIFELDNGGFLEVGAYGDINLAFIDKKTNDTVEEFKDKCNGGSLYDRLGHFVNNDKDLINMLNNKHKKYECVMENNNWFEINYIDKEGNFHDFMFADNVLNTDMIDEIEKEVMDNIDYWLALVKDIEVNNGI